MDYLAALNDRLVSEGLASDSTALGPAGNGQRPLFAGRATNVTLETIARKVQQDGPQILADLTHPLYGLFRENSFPIYTFWDDYRSLLRTDYGIDAMKLRDAIKRVHGDFDKIASPNISQTRRKQPRPRVSSLVLYADLQSLDAYIRERASASTVVLIKWKPDP